MSKRTQLALSSPAPDVHVIHIRGLLDRITGNRLVRLVDVRSTLAREHGAATQLLLVDLTGVEAADRDGLRALSIARRDARHRRVAFDLVGDPDTDGMPAGPERADLRGTIGFASVAAAVAAHESAPA